MNGEVLAPGGSLDHALWALEGGADAVYVGLQQFSARSHAHNLSLDDLAILCGQARIRDARVFVALNTILRTEELPQALALAWEAWYRGAHALIVQDLGLATAMRDHGPPLDLHASTQAAVHNPSGAAALKVLGFKRIVLARELTLKEIGAMVRADPDLEYEVFVHGALCYAVSGNCMASGLMIGRSANRGDCGQVCRTNFSLDRMIPGPRRRRSPHEEDAEGEIHAPPGEITWAEGSSGAFASMNDLELGPRVRELAALGIKSFKIEGRMKPPAYAYHTARAYKAFLSGNRDPEGWASLDEARLQFGRLPSAGWIDGHKALAQTNPGWAGSLGMPLGSGEGLDDQGRVVLSSPRDSSFWSDLAKGDGVMVLGRERGQTLRTSLEKSPEVQGRRIHLSLGSAPAFPVEGSTLWLMSRHDGKLPQKKGGRAWRHPLKTRAGLRRLSGNLGADLLEVRLASPELGGLEAVWTFPWEDARGMGVLAHRLEEELQSSDGIFVLGAWTLDEQAPGAFLPPRLVKELRRDWYGRVAAAHAEWIAKVGTIPAPKAPEAPPLSRRDLGPRRGVNETLGFVVEWAGLADEDLALAAGARILPLAPFVPQEEAYFQGLREFILRRDQASPLLLGVNNPAHLHWLRRLDQEGLKVHGWFSDWGLHSANPWHSQGLGRAFPGMRWSVHWLEDDGRSDTSYQPPLFTSRSCMLRNSFGQVQAPPVPADSVQFVSREVMQARMRSQKGAATAQAPRPRCPADCAGHFSAVLHQGKKAFRLEARDCINYLLAEAPTPGR